MAKSTDRPVSKAKIDLARKELLNNPTLTATEFGKTYNISGETARIALIKARDELKETDEQNGLSAANIRQRQVVKALETLDRQMVRLDSLPEILQALRRKTFQLKDGTVVGIKSMIKGYNKEGDPIYLTPASIVNEYLQAEKAILEQERIVTGIAAAERAQTASAGKSEVNLHLPLSPEAAAKIIPVKKGIV